MPDGGELSKIKVSFSLITQLILLKEIFTSISKVKLDHLTFNTILELYNIFRIYGRWLENSVYKNCMEITRELTE